MMPMLSVGTDCSGLDAVGEALRQLRVRYNYAFASDICPVVRRLLVQGPRVPTCIYEDVTTRDVNDVPPVDIYVAGFPCQAFSRLGKQRGLVDPRGTVFYSVLAYIQTQRPRVFILENVPNLVHHNKGATWKLFWDKLTALKGYSVEYRVLSPHEFGWPQRRPRLFVVGLRGEIKFKWPRQGGVRQHLDTLLLSREEARALYPSCTRTLAPGYAKSLKVLQRKAAARGVDLEKEPFVLMLGQSATYLSLGQPGVAPTMTSHSENAYLTHQGRFLLPEETLLLQGFDPDHTAIQLPANKLRLLTGNSIHVGLLKLLLHPLLKALKAVERS